jgi:hypothetical protein
MRVQILDTAEEDLVEGYWFYEMQELGCTPPQLQEMPRYFGAREATIFSKHGSPRKESQNGKSFNWP